MLPSSSPSSQEVQKAAKVGFVAGEDRRGLGKEADIVNVRQDAGRGRPAGLGRYLVDQVESEALHHVAQQRILSHCLSADPSLPFEDRPSRKSSTSVAVHPTIQCGPSLGAKAIPRSTKGTRGEAIICPKTKFRWLFALPSTIRWKRIGLGKRSS